MTAAALTATATRTTTSEIRTSTTHATTITGSEKDFCQVTGQPDWCAEKGGCMEDQNKKCPRKHWCVCQWAFTGYIHTAGGCDKIQNVVCDAVNMEALKAYEKGAKSGASADGGKVADALACLKKKCPGIGSSS